MSTYNRKERLELYKRVIQTPGLFQVYCYFKEATPEIPYRQYFCSVVPNFDIIPALEAEAMLNGSDKLIWKVKDLNAYRDIFLQHEKVFY